MKTNARLALLLLGFAFPACTSLRVGSDVAAVLVQVVKPSKYLSSTPA